MVKANQEFKVDTSNAIDVSHLEEWGFSPVAYAEINDKGKDRLTTVIPFEGKDDDFSTRQELIYLIVIDDCVVKVGGTYTGLKARLASYSAGTRANRKRGTCSTTNYHISETQYTSLVNGSDVEWWMFAIEPVEVSFDVPWDGKVSYSTKTYMKYESTLVDWINDQGYDVPLSPNTGVE
jgi:hypothetical protein